MRTLLAATAATAALIVIGCEKKGATPAAAPTAASASASVAPSGDTILLGEVFSLTGGQATFGVSSRNGIEMAVKEANAAGGVKGKKLETRVYDDQGKPEEAANAITQVRAGTIKAYAVMTEARWHLAPDIPTIDEAGAQGLHVSYWHALFAPKATPPDVIAKVNAAVVNALADAKVRQSFAAQGQDIWPREQQTPQALAALYKAEIDKWWPIIRDEHLHAE